MDSVGMTKKFWRGKRVLVTGHTGFKGSWLCLWLLELGAQVAGYALPPSAERNNYVLCGLARHLKDTEGDITDYARLEKTFLEFQPEIVFHLAAQPLVRRSYQEPRLTYETNVMGTLNVLEAARKAGSVRGAVMITTDKCYENQGFARGYREADPMGGYDPYSSSKGCAELLIASYRRSFCRCGGTGESKMAVASARAGNVIGGGDWSPDRLVPDCIRAIEAGRPVRLRNPKAVRPWQFVLEPLSGYLALAERLWTEPEQYVGGWNFGPDPKQMATVETMARALTEAYGAGVVECQEDPNAPHEDPILLLDSTKAGGKLGWHSRLSLAETLDWTAEWYRDYRREAPSKICQRQLNLFTSMGKTQA